MRGYRHNVISHRNDSLELLKNQSLVTKVPYNIPPNIHYVWVNNKDKATYLNEDANTILSNNFSILQNSDLDWEHYLWINNSPNHSRTIEMFESLGGKVKFIESLPSYSAIKDEVEHSIRLSSFGKASDYIRFAILNDFGGLYLDIDYALDNDITVFHQILDFYTATENWKSDWLSSALIGATKSHPIIRGALEYTTRGPEKNFPNCEYDEKDISVATGPGGISLSYYKYAGLDNRVDVAFHAEIGQSSKNYGVFEDKNYESSITLNIDGQDILIEKFGMHWGMNTWSHVLDDNSQNVIENFIDSWYNWLFLDSDL